MMDIPWQWVMLLESPLIGVIERNAAFAPSFGCYSLNDTIKELQFLIVPEPFS